MHSVILAVAILCLHGLIEAWAHAEDDCLFPNLINTAWSIVLHTLYWEEML